MRNIFGNSHSEEYLLFLMVHCFVFLFMDLKGQATIFFYIILYIKQFLSLPSTQVLIGNCFGLYGYMPKMKHQVWSRWRFCIKTDEQREINKSSRDKRQNF